MKRIVPSNWKGHHGSLGTGDEAPEGREARMDSILDGRTILWELSCSYSLYRV
jgi:hypothetical protein